MVQDDDEIRPGIWLLALCLLAGTGLTLWLTFSDDSETWATSEAGAYDEPFDAGVAMQNAPALRSSSDAPVVGLHAQAYGGGPGVEADPQLDAMHRTVGSPDAGIAPFEPRTWHGRLTNVRGSVPVSEGESCDVRVLPVRTRFFNCLVRVMCGGVVLYPDGSQEAGYAPCDVTDGVPTRAVDGGTTLQDGDPAIEVDLLARRVRVADEMLESAFEAEVVLDQRMDQRL